MRCRESIFAAAASSEVLTFVLREGKGPSESCYYMVLTLRGDSPPLPKAAGTMLERSRKMEVRVKMSSLRSAHRAEVVNVLTAP